MRVQEIRIPLYRYVQSKRISIVFQRGLILTNGHWAEKGTTCMNVWNTACKIVHCVLSIGIKQGGVKEFLQSPIH